MATILKHIRVPFIIAIAAVCVTGSTVLAQNTPAPAGYKIGVVDMQKLIADSPTRKSQYDALQKDVDRLQGEIDKVQQDLEAQKKKLEDSAAAMTDDQRSQARAKFEQDTLNYRYELDKRQRMIDNQEKTVLDRVIGDIEKAIEQVASADGYHLILNSKGGSRGVVLYAQSTIDITPKVAQILGTGAAAAAPAAPAPKKK